MCDIKFRAWDNLEKAYLNEEDIAIDNLGNIFIFERYDNNDADLWYTRLLPDPDNKRHVIEQYTGLKDKNGREIYEGDIIKYYPHHNGIPYRVYWADESAKFLIGRDGVVGQELSDVMYDLDAGRIALEAIGNIHEDYDLLEEK